jgi:hypothetical protein
MPSDYIKREDAVMCCPGGDICDPAQIADAIRDLPASPLLAAREDALFEALFVFACRGEEIRVGDFTIQVHSGDVADDDGWLVTRDGEMSGVCYDDFDQAVRDALREQEQQQDGGPK